VTNQIEGGIIQAASWTLKEQVRIEDGRIAGTDWDSYPILVFSEVPEIEIRLNDRPDAPPLGAGEAAQGPTAAAIANAVTRALGVRIRDLPLTRERILAAMLGSTD
jgi:CO/xanthine dehydrogenase Mo-binding subunit